MARAKPFDIPKREVWEAYKRVRANQGTAGVDEQSIADFEADLTNNLYKLWNRLTSGSYQPDTTRLGELLRGGAFQRVLQLHQRLGGKEGSAPHAACSETKGLRLDAME